MLSFYVCLFTQCAVDSQWDPVAEIGHTAEYCRSIPETCINAVCGCLRPIGIDCSESATKVQVFDKITNCYDFNTCFDDLVKKNPTPDECRSKPDLCMAHACEFIESKGYDQCYKQGVVHRLEDLMRNCYGPSVESCLEEDTTLLLYDADAKFVLPRKCKRYPDKCLDHACEVVKNFHKLNCTEQVKGWIKEVFKNCRYPYFNSCLQGPVPFWFSNNRSPKRITPPMCRDNPEGCMRYACSKMRADYKKSCRISKKFRYQLKRSLEKCYAISVALCLVNANYEIKYE